MFFNSNYNDDNEFAIIGTPFAALESDEIVSRKPEIDQTVRDDKGRRRFHGAFTGGFSAGYWNTVGSAEGFTPKIFSSSRQNKNDRLSFAHKPEDFMDDEDFGAFGIAPKRIHTNDNFAENSSFAGLRNTETTFDDVIQSVFKPTKESIGKKIFKNMKRNAKLDQKSKHDNLFLIDSEDIENEREELKDDLYEPKDNFHGLGYNGMLNVENFLYSDKDKKKKDEGVAATLSGGRRIKISGEAFGYGALEDDDGMSVYSKDDMSQYDFAIGSLPKHEKSKNKRIPFSTNNNSEEIELEGFIKSKKAVNLFEKIKQQYRPPTVPKDWKPRNVAKPIKKSSRWDLSSNSTTTLPQSSTITTTQANSSDKSFKQQPTLNANLRAVILGEEIVYKQGVAKKPELNQNEKVNKTESKQLSFDRELNKQQATTRLSQVQVSQTPLSGFFASKFTRSSTNGADEQMISAGLNSFSDVSSLSDFKPKPKTNIEDDEAAANKKPVRTSFEWHPHKLLCRRFGIQNPYPLYPDIVGIICIDSGTKARNSTSIIQDKSSMTASTTSVKKTLFTNLFQDLNTLNNFNPLALNPAVSPIAQAKNSSEATKQTNQLLSFEKSWKEQQEEEAKLEEEEPLVERPPIDLFKSIFASDEEDDGSDDEDDVQQDQSKQQLKPESKQNESNPVESSTSNHANQSFNSDGIFSGINFDDMNRNFNPRLPPASSSVENGQSSIAKDVPNKNLSETDLPKIIDLGDDEDDCYGPALPPVPPSSKLQSNISSLNNSTIKPTKSTSDKSHKKVKSSKSDRKHRKKKKKHSVKKHKKKHSKKSSHKHSPKGKLKTDDSCSSDFSSSDSSSPDLETKLLSLIKKARHH